MGLLGDAEKPRIRLGPFQTGQRAVLLHNSSQGAILGFDRITKHPKTPHIVFRLLRVRKNLFINSIPSGEDLTNISPPSKFNGPLIMFQKNRCLVYIQHFPRIDNKLISTGCMLRPSLVISTIILFHQKALD